MSGVKGRSGGFRKGAGRKVGSKRIKRHYSLTEEAYLALQQVPIGQRSDVLSAAVLAYLKP